MSEQSFVTTLLSMSIEFPWRTRTAVHHVTELRITDNRADIVYFQHTDESAVGVVIAVEAKLRDWRKAIRQAYRDKLFANRAYVALPECYASAAISNIAEFQRAAVGLVVLEEGNARFYHHPPASAPLSPYHSRIAKQSLKTLIHG